MQESATRACLALHRCPELGRRACKQLISAVAHPEQVFALGDSELRGLGLDAGQRAALQLASGASVQQQVERDWQLMQQQQITLLGMSCPDYPALLAELDDAPPWLYVRGESALLNRPQLAIVGSRHASPQGAQHARDFAAALAELGMVITSGMAQGIDSAAHWGALGCASREPWARTIAVLGTGVDRAYPRANRGLYQQLVSRAAVISELPLGSAPLRGHFPQRNRLISGLSLGVLVIEAVLKSGSLITARRALEQNREVFALPGSIHAPASRGPHQLIRQGAKLVESVADILEELSAWYGSEAAPARAVNGGDADDTQALSDDERQLLNLLGGEALSLEQLCALCQWPAARVVAVATALEIRGLLAQRGGIYQRLQRLS